MNLPVKFVDEMKQLLGDSYNQFYNALKDEPVKALTFDFNKISKVPDEICQKYNLLPVEGVKNGFYYTGKIGSSLLHHAGVLYSQDASAMFPVVALGVKENDIVLDLCSAPGGKSIQILEDLNNTGLLISNEYVFNRAKILYENVTRFGYSNSVITNNLPKVFENKIEVFDKILVDAPCSGEGMFRKKNIDIHHWNEKNVETCVLRQLEILQSVSKSLKKGGYLVYSTCTYNLHENEQVVVEFLKKNKDYKICDLPMSVQSNTERGYIVDPNYDTSKAGRRYPHKHKGEGQFLVLLQRESGEEYYSSASIYCDKYTPLSKKEKEIISKQMQGSINISSMNLYKKNSNIYVVPSVKFDYLGLNVLSLGTVFGTVEKSGIKINHAFYKAFYKHFVNKIELDEKEASIYLTGNIVNLDKSLSGLVVVCYKGVPLGGGKISNGVLKNYYPKELREK